MKKLCRKSGKVKFETHEQAAKRAGEIILRDKAPDAPLELRAYRCRHCGKYHLTSQGCARKPDPHDANLNKLFGPVTQNPKTERQK